MNIDHKEVESIIFGIFSPKEIEDMSVCLVDSTKLTGPGSVYDERMGPSMDNNTPCVTCGRHPKSCPGHFGHIILHEYIIHPLFYKLVVSFLRCFCIHCNRLLITKDQIDVCGLSRFKNDRRFKKILEKLEKVDICCHDDCNHPQPKISYSITDNSIAMVYKEKINVDVEGKGVVKKDSKISITLTVDEIKKLFDSISDEDVELCGFVPSRTHPRNLILSVFPVIPPCARPFVMAEGNICDDDLTNQILEIIKINNILKTEEKEIPDEKKETKRQKAVQSLKFRITTFYNNSQGKAKHPTNGRPIKGLKERITGKDGQIRNNLMGKRVEFSGRTVIGPDPNLKFGWMGVPEEIAQELTIPERVTDFNKEYLSGIVNNGHANFVIKNGGETRINLKYAMFRKGTELLYGDTVIRGGLRIKVENDNIDLKKGDKVERSGKIMEGVSIGDIVIREEKRISVKDSTFNLKAGDRVERKGKIINQESVLYFPTKKKIYLDIGDEVHRHLKDGDTVLLNRQPTLHKGSMLAKKIRVMPGKTFRFNLDTTKTFNADFDKPF